MWGKLTFLWKFLKTTTENIGLYFRAVASNGMFLKVLLQENHTFFFEGIDILCYAVEELIGAID